MELDSAILLLSAVVLLLFAILVGVVYAAAPATDGSSSRRNGVQELDDLNGRLAAMTPRIARLDAETRHLEDLAAIHAEVARLQQESQHLRGERTALLAPASPHHRVTRARDPTALGAVADCPRPRR